MLSAAISAALLGALVAPGTIFAQETDESIEEIITTGTRIVRTDMFDAAGHVVNVEEAQIDALAVLNISDVLRSSPLNAYGSFNERSGNSAQSNATFDLRGLGAHHTLVMVDGMRLPGSPNLGADAVNINMLPMAAVQRIDILADGASAVYGSDAVAGVVNLVLHKGFEGGEVSLRYGDRAEGDGGDESIVVLAGFGNDRGHVTFAMEYSHRDPIFDRDRPYTSAWIRDTDGDGEIHVYTDTDGISYFGRSWEIYDPNTGYYELAAAADCPTTDGFTGVMGAGAFGLPAHTLCTYAYADISANRAELEKMNSYLYASYDLNSNVELYARGLFSKNESFGRYAPPAASWPNPPASHPHNPFDIEQMIADGLITDQAELWGYYRWTNIGPRDGYMDDTQWDAVVGLKGDISDNVSFDVYAHAGDYTSVNKGKYYLSYPGLEYVVDNNIDPFSEEGAEIMRATPGQDNFTRQNRLYAHVQFGTGDLFGAGEAIGLIGAEYTDIGYRNQYDPESEAGNIGGSAGNSSAGERDFWSAFVEYLLPVTDNSELNFSGRYDDYSDFGSAFSPSVSYNIAATDSLALRARWGRGFKAPALDSMYGAESFSANGAYDPITDSRRQFTTWYHVNPDLDAESSTSYSLGMNWEYVDGHSIDLAYYAVEIDDVITWPGAQSLIYADVAGVSFDPEGTRVERRGTNISEIYSYASNADKLKVSGIDFQTHSLFDSDWGVFSIDAFVSYQLEYKQNAYYKGGFQDTAGFHFQPQTRGQASVTWDLGNHGVDWIVDYMGPYSEEDNVDEQTGVLSTSSKDLDSWTTMSLAYRYDGGRLGQIKIGANNVANRDPVLNIEGKYDNSWLHDAIGRVVYVEYRKTFD
jgi:iron complex outermembrane receptor protein